MVKKDTFMSKDFRIKMVGLDLDGTTLNKEGKLSELTKKALHKAMKRGIHIVVTTGRTFASLPKEITDIEELEYIITSNGAHITRMEDRNLVYSNYIPKEAIIKLINIFKEEGYSIEVFTGGKAYMESEEYYYFKNCEKSYRDIDYIVRTRNPIEGIYDFMLSHSGKIENININFEDLDEKEKAKAVLEKVPGITLTSSFIHNWEIGGESTSKGNALKTLAKMLDVNPEEELLACGDSPNDISMIKLAKVGIAVANATEETKAASDFVFPSNDEDGVAKALYEYVLND